MKIFIGADHNGFEYKSKLSQALTMAGHEVVDEGDVSIDPNDDYPQFASKVVTEMLTSGDPEARGILVCGSGQGMCIAANRFKGIRASLCWNQNEARAARNDDDSNILCLSSRYLSLEEAGSIMTTFLTTPFAAAPRFTRRIQQLDQLT
ncbi:MAG TPA: RpiB/LacA/LacB family sugar-phosphate isomerase [Verrucomicrobiae bacterium]|jgi:ribose 5-phosphate isomerase B|nr:RpiB/LacA/LacB family sugar-phosphate isomerase [Verrucomicrobiae bacterium]